MRSDIMEQVSALKAKMDANQKIADMVDAAGGISVTVEQSDKLGFNWRVYSVNNMVVRRNYEEQVNPVGTVNNPISWKPDAKLIPNGYYIYNGTTKVWMGENGASVDWDNEGWVVV